MFADLIAPPLVMRFDDLARDRIDELLSQPVARIPVHLREGDPLSGGDGWIKSNRPADERQLEVTLPMRARGDTS